MKEQAEPNKSCPFCGSAAAKIDTISFPVKKETKFRVICSACGVSAKWDDSRDAAWQCWNRRETPPAAPKKGEKA